MSILIPTIEHPHATFESHTIGIQANCSVPPVIGGTPCEASGAMLDCSNVGVRLIPTANDSASLDNAIFSESYYDWAAEAYSGDRTTIQDIPCRRKLSNPVKSLIQLGWEMTPGFEQNMSSNPSISMVPGDVPKYRLFASCDIAVYNVTVKYNGTVEGRKYWGLLNKTLSKPWIADVVLSAHSHNAAAEHIGVNIKSRAMRNGSDDDIEASLGQEVSRLALGMVAGMFDITEAHNVTNYQEIMVGCYKLAPLFTFVLLLMIYGFMALVVFFMAFNMRSGTIVVPHNPQATKSANQKNTRTVSILELVQFRLSSPIPTIVQCFPRANNSVYETGPNHVDAQSVAKKVSTLFSETNPGSTESRVRLEIRETAVRPIFGAWGYEVIVLKNKPSNPF
ncbi:hypothetical protein BN14_11602 [Rhizoctonia solani AG-1 IB]|uniref:Uncharacterized protein n=1 Tax=Thanatephorus cucumeris (strain AG1-IB / isolate 7/3/14) TaxID=1108050 RepID=M5CDE1_THACB|nr:hypothetical protein BN14_11602 [Rhizoctonia solani AG-1 IB]